MKKKSNIWACLTIIFENIYFPIIENKKIRKTYLIIKKLISIFLLLRT